MKKKWFSAYQLDTKFNLISRQGLKVSVPYLGFLNRKAVQRSKCCICYKNKYLITHKVCERHLQWKRGSNNGVHYLIWLIWCCPKFYLTTPLPTNISPLFSWLDTNYTLFGKYRKAVIQTSRGIKKKRIK